MCASDGRCGNSFELKVGDICYNFLDRDVQVAKLALNSVDYQIGENT